MAQTAQRWLRAALIDLDGTLMHTAPDLALAANRVRVELGLPSERDALIPRSALP
jgi:phosphoglycolate phosphatase